MRTIFLLYLNDFTELTYQDREKLEGQGKGLPMLSLIWKAPKGKMEVEGKKEGGKNFTII